MPTQLPHHVSVGELVAIADAAFGKYKGSVDEIERAIGMLVIGRHIGWRVIYLMHSKATVRKYENLLGIKVREFFPEEGTLANKSVAWKALKTLKGYWKIVSGDQDGRSMILK